MLAGGQVDRLPIGVEALAQRWGESVVHCPFCRRWGARDTLLAVQGGAVEQAGMARYLRSHISADVVLCTHGPARLPDGMLAARGVAVRSEPVTPLDVALDDLTVVFAEGIATAHSGGGPDLAARLRGALLSGPELAAGPVAWERWLDPFGAAHSDPCEGLHDGAGTSAAHVRHVHD